MQLHANMWLLYAVIFLLAVYFLIKKKPLSRFPGPAGIPLFGNAFQISSERMHLKLSEWACQYGPVFEMRLFGQRFIVLSSEEIIRKAMATDTVRHALNGRQAMYYGQYINYKSESIPFTNDLDLHGELRKAYAKGLHIYGEGIQVFEDIVTKEMLRMVSMFRNHEGQDFDPSGIVKIFLANVLSILLNGKPVNVSDKPDDVFCDLGRASDDMLNPNLGLIATTFPFLRFVPGKIRRITNRLLKAKRQIILDFVDSSRATLNPKETRGLVDFMLHSQADDIANGHDVLFTDGRIVNTTLDTVGAGFNTSDAALRSALLCLIHHQDCQEKVHQEILKVIGPDRKPTIHDRANMPYTEAVIYEVMRFAPPTPLGIPHLCTMDVDFEGHRILSGDLIMLNLWHVQQSREVWGDPFSFRPERFLDEHGELVDSSHRLRKSC